MTPLPTSQTLAEWLEGATGLPWRPLVRSFDGAWAEVAGDRLRWHARVYVQPPECYRKKLIKRERRWVIIACGHTAPARGIGHTKQPYMGRDSVERAALDLMATTTHQETP